MPTMLWRKRRASSRTCHPGCQSCRCERTALAEISGRPYLRGMRYELYGNRGESGVKAYAITQDSIRVKFSDGTYLYNYARPGRTDVEQMKTLARRGHGLSTYISRNVKDRYAAKI